MIGGGKNWKDNRKFGNYKNRSIAEKLKSSTRKKKKNEWKRKQPEEDIMVTVLEMVGYQKTQ